MTDREIIEGLIAAAKAYHDALDQMFAMAITLTAGTKEPFFPSKNPDVWKPMVLGKHFVEAAEQHLRNKGQS